MPGPPDQPPRPGPLARRREARAGPVENYQPRPKRPEFDEFPSDDDVERFGGVTFTCPECRTILYDDVDLCWNCGHAIGAQSQTGSGIPRWVVAVGVLVAAGLILLAVLGR